MRREGSETVAGDENETGQRQSQSISEKFISARVISKFQNQFIAAIPQASLPCLSQQRGAPF